MSVVDPNYYVIGSRSVSGGNYGRNNYAEIWMYSRALDTTERQAVETYLKTKWGL